MINDKMSNLDIAISILEIQYIKAMGREVSIDPRINQDLYPAGWASISNSNIKAKILKEAIDKKCLIKDTTEYSQIQEGVRKTRTDSNNKREER